jgi:maltoporin
VNDSGTGQDGVLYKLTLAPQVSLGDRFFSRPVIRAFVTYAAWSDGFKGQIGGNDYANDTTFEDWKLDGGIGFRLAWNLSTIVSFDYGRSGEGTLFYMELGHQF